MQPIDVGQEARAHAKCVMCDPTRYPTMPTRKPGVSVGVLKDVWFDNSFFWTQGHVKQNTCFNQNAEKNTKGKIHRWFVFIVRDVIIIIIIFFFFFSFGWFRIWITTWSALQKYQKVSNEKGPWLFTVYRGWNTTQLCRDWHHEMGIPNKLYQHRPQIAKTNFCVINVENSVASARS